MTNAELEAAIGKYLLMMPEFQGASLTVNMLGNEMFVLTGLDANGQELNLRTGKVHVADLPRLAIGWSEVLPLRPDQTALYQAVFGHVSRSILEGQEKGLTEIPLMKDNEFPGLFQSFVPDKTVHNVVREGQIDIWNNVDSMVRLWGYDCVLVTGGDPVSTDMFAIPRQNIFH